MIYCKYIFIYIHKYISKHIPGNIDGDLMRYIVRISLVRQWNDIAAVIKELGLDSHSWTKEGAASVRAMAQQIAMVILMMLVGL